MRIAPVHYDINAVEAVFKEILIRLELERIRHDACGIRKHAILGDDGITFDMTRMRHGYLRKGARTAYSRLTPARTRSRKRINRRGVARSML